jgi:hypothetical protein
MRKITIVIPASAKQLTSNLETKGLVEAVKSMELVEYFHKHLENPEMVFDFTLHDTYYFVEAYLHPAMQRVFPEWLLSVANKPVTLYTFSPLMVLGRKEGEVLAEERKGVWSNESISKVVKQNRP